MNKIKQFFKSDEITNTQIIIKGLLLAVTVYAWMVLIAVMGG